MTTQREKRVNRIKDYLEDIDECPFKITSTIRGYLELKSEHVRVLLAALCDYETEDEEKMECRDKLLKTFF